MNREPLVFTKRFIVRVHYVRYGERLYPRSGNIQERIFGSKEARRIKIGETLDGKPIHRTTRPMVSMTAHEVLALLQRELRRGGVDKITVQVV